MRLCESGLIPVKKGKTMMTSNTSKALDKDVLKASHLELLAQWEKSIKRASMPETPAHLFRTIPSYHVDVPAAKMDALEAARAFACVSARLAQDNELKATPGLRHTLNAMAEFSAAQYEEAARYADLKWPYTLIDRNTEIDTAFHKRRRDTAQEAMMNIVDALGALAVAR